MPPDNILLFGQIFGLCLAALSFLVYLQKSRGEILITKLILDVLNIFQQAMVGAFTGSVINGIAVLREIVFYHKEEKKWAKSKVWLIVFLLLMTAAPIVSWQGFISLLPAIGSSLVVVGFYCSNPKLLRIFGIIGQSFWVVYSCIILNLGGIIGSSLCILGGIIGFINDLKIQKINESDKKIVKEKNNEG